jgi:hypothetical protein
VGTRTRSPARMQRASRSIVSLLLKILSSIRASAISSSLCLHGWKKRKRQRVGFKGWGYGERVLRSVPAGFVFCRCHRREFAVDADQALKRPLRLRAHHFRVYLR